MTIASKLSLAQVEYRIDVMVRWAKHSHKEARRYSRKSKAEEEAASVAFLWDEISMGYRREAAGILACARLLKGTFDESSDKKRAGRAVLALRQELNASAVLANV
jgi:hypothetical protein